MQTFILLCFDKKAVVYSVKGESVQECRFRGNETLSLEWGDERFAEVWEYFEDVYDISSWENTEILIYCVNKKEVPLWDKVRYPVSQNVKSVTVDNITEILPKLATAKGLLEKGGIVFTWRDYAWKVTLTACELYREKAEREDNAFDFAELINRFFTDQNQESAELADSLRINFFENKGLLKELEQTKLEFQEKIRQLSQQAEKQNQSDKQSQIVRHEVNDFDFAELISQFLIAKNKESAKLVASLQANSLENQKLLQELEQAKQEFQEKIRQLSQQLEKQERQNNQLVKDNQALNIEKRQLQNKIEQLQKDIQPYYDFLNSSDTFMRNPNTEKDAKKKEVIEWTKKIYGEMEFVYGITEKLYKEIDKGRFGNDTIRENLTFRKVFSYDIVKRIESGNWLPPCPIRKKGEDNICSKTEELELSGRYYSNIFISMLRSWKTSLSERNSDRVNFSRVDLTPSYSCEYKKILCENLSDLLRETDLVLLISYTFAELDKGKGLIDKFISLEHYDKKPNNGRYYSYKKNK